jgi:hypothetical protein
MAAGSTAARQARRCAPAREPCCVTWEARPKPGPASSPNVSKRGLTARLDALHQTPIMVNTRLPKGILTGAKRGSPGGYGNPGWPLAAAPSNDETGCAPAFPRRDAPEVFQDFVPPENRGRRECRMRAAPAVSRAMWTRSTHTSIQGSGGNPTFPAQWLYGLLRALPGDRLSCHRRSHGKFRKSLTPAPRRQDHTSSPYASAPFVKGTSASTASHRAFVTCATPLLSGETGGVLAVICPGR